MDSNQHLNITIDRIKELVDKDEEDEYDCIVTEYAIDQAITLISAAAQICTKFFKPWVSMEYNGGIYLTWCNPKSARSLRLLVPGSSEPNSYIYYEEKEEYDSQLNINPQDLSKWIDWVNTDTN